MGQTAGVTLKRTHISSKAERELETVTRASRSRDSVWEINWERVRGILYKSFLLQHFLYFNIWLVLSEAFLKIILDELREMKGSDFLKLCRKRSRSDNKNLEGHSGLLLSHPSSDPLITESCNPTRSLPSRPIPSPLVLLHGFSTHLLFPINLNEVLSSHSLFKTQSNKYNKYGAHFLNSVQWLCII